MAQLTNTIVNGDLRVTGNIYGTLSGNAATATKATQDGNGNTISSTYLKLSGGTMSGVLTLKSGQYDDSITSSTSHALNLQNSNIIGINAMYTSDAAENAAEGIHFFRDSTHFDSLWASGGYMYFVPNRALGAQTSAADSRKVGILPASITTNQVVLTDGTNGYLKTLAASSLAAGSCEYPAGFASRNTGAQWGTHPNGTLVTDWADGNGGDIAFWKNCPSNGQLSVLVDGYCYQREGLYRCVDTSEVNLNGAAVIQYSSTTDTVDIKFN